MRCRTEGESVKLGQHMKVSQGQARCSRKDDEGHGPALMYKRGGKYTIGKRAHGSPSLPLIPLFLYSLLNLSVCR